MPRRIALFSLVIATVVTGTAGCDDVRQAGSVLSTTTSVAVASEECKPAFFSLPPMQGHRNTDISAMNNAGLAVGNSSFEDSAGGYFSRAVMWSDDGVVIDLGLGGRLGPGNVKVSSGAVDVNEQGDVLAQRFYDPAGKGFVSSSWLWRDGVKLRLRATKKLPVASALALNDHGVAVGYVDVYDGGHYRPSAWANGKQVRLPIPEGATGMAMAINNSNLIVGWVHVDASDSGPPWFWRLNGRSGPLPTLPSGQPYGALEVDNQNRILGRMVTTQGWQGVVWPAGPNSKPYSYGGPAVTRAADMDDHGDLTGTRAGHRDMPGDAWVSRIGAKKVVHLPTPAGGNGSSGRAVIHGVTWFAPEGGVSVGGSTNATDQVGTFRRATIWTCTQTY